MQDILLVNLAITLNAHRSFFEIGYLEQLIVNSRF